MGSWALSKVSFISYHLILLRLLDNYKYAFNTYCCIIRWVIFFVSFAMRITGMWTHASRISTRVCFFIIPLLIDHY